MDSTTGAYQVHTTASHYLIDLDRKVIRRIPRANDESGPLLRRDEELIMLHDVVELTVGKPMVLILDLNVVGVDFTTRTTSTVVSIDQIGPSNAEAGE